MPAAPFEAKLPVSDKLWFGKQAAVVLTYDDALEVHLDNAIPALEAKGFIGSFYLTANADGSKNRISDWKRASQNGHELGNHTLYHPCDNKDGSRDWVTPENDLSNYNTAQLVREVDMTNTFLQALDGKRQRTFAYTCGDKETSEGSFIEAIKDDFVALRGVHADINSIDEMDFTNLNCYVVDNSNADQMIEWAEKAKKENALLVILFHGVGGGHPSTIDLDKHEAFLDYLKTNEKDFWVTTLLEASQHAKAHKKD
nr:polysaccharide deacetylase family protein [Fulvivirga lutimaris]